jgi:CBS domain-containing protein
VKDRQLIGIITRSDILDFVLSGSRVPALGKKKTPTMKAAVKKAKIKRK